MSRYQLSQEERQILIRKTFDALTAVGFMKFQAEERALGNELTEEDRQLYFSHFKVNYFAGFQNMAANAPDEGLLDTWQFWRDKPNSLRPEEVKQFLADLQAGPRPGDFVIEDHGSVWRFTPLSTQAKLFADAELQLESWQWQE